MTTALVTGASGHIGSWIARACADAGMRPIAFCRESSDRRALDDRRFEVRVGDLLDRPSVEAAMRDVDVVFHAGAVHRNFAVDPDDIVRPAVEGTRNVIAAARAAGVPRIVYTSSGATVGFASSPEARLTEDDHLETAAHAYTRAKIEAERVARAAVADGGVDVVILNPSGVFGPGDFRLTPASKALAGMVQGDPAFFAVSVTDVRDVAAAHLLAAREGVSGRRYIIAGDVLTPVELSRAIEEVTGIRPPTFRPPLWLARFLAGMAERKARRTGEDATLTRGILDDFYGKHLSYDSTRARDELGWSYRPAADVLRDAFGWLADHGGLKPKVAAKVKAAQAG